MNYHIKSFILPVHLLAIVGTVALVMDLIQWSWTAFFIGWTAIYGLGLVTGFHKLLSHNSFKTHRIIKWILTYFGCLGISGSPIWWCAIHRGYHHAHTESEQDLQTPRRGLFSSYIGWQFGPETSKISLKYAADLARDPVMIFFHKQYRNIVWSTIIITSIISPSLSFSLLIIPMLAAHHGENITNSLGHSKFAGYRNYKTTDDTINNPILALLTWGQLLHNNHHAKPNSSSFAKRWWEIDPTDLFVWCFKRIK